VVFESAISRADGAVVPELLHNPVTWIRHLDQGFDELGVVAGVELVSRRSRCSLTRTPRLDVTDLGLPVPRNAAASRDSTPAASRSLRSSAPSRA